MAIGDLNRRHILARRVGGSLTNTSGMNTASSLPPVDLSGDPNIFPNTGIALATRVLAHRTHWMAVVDDILPWDPARARIAPSTLLLMLIMNLLTHHNPLYQVELWAESLPLPIVLLALMLIVITSTHIPVTRTARYSRSSGDQGIHKKSDRAAGRRRRFRPFPLESTNRTGENRRPDDNVISQTHDKKI